MANLPARRDSYGLSPAVQSNVVQRQMTGKPVRGILREAGKQALEQQLQAEQTAAALYYKTKVEQVDNDSSNELIAESYANANRHEGADREAYALIREATQRRMLNHLASSEQIVARHAASQARIVDRSLAVEDKRWWQR